LSRVAIHGQAAIYFAVSVGGAFAGNSGKSDAAAKTSAQSRSSKMVARTLFLSYRHAPPGACRRTQNTEHKMAQNVAESMGTLDMNRASHPGTETG
jgi:hypothetical protein